ncbi:hypothetical protein IG631_05078 [Alternaria alternata]|nr:hypothetical protein IG631_05078 [Alternaria alternata]
MLEPSSLQQSLCAAQCRRLAQELWWWEWATKWKPCWKSGIADLSRSTGASFLVSYTGSGSSPYLMLYGE